MELKKIELHDALLKSMAIDYAARSITVTVDYYKNKGDHERMHALIIFDTVESLSEVSNFDGLNSFVSSGNIVQWVPAKGSGTTYIDLTGGCIAITAKEMHFKPEY
jgi:hypothetical protein